MKYCMNYWMKYWMKYWMEYWMEYWMNGSVVPWREQVLAKTFWGNRAPQPRKATDIVFAFETIVC